MTLRDLPIEPPAPAIPDDNAPLPPARRGTRWTVRRGRTIAFVLLGLALAVSLLSVYATYQAAKESAAQAAAVDRRLAVLEEFVDGRGEYRDREAERLQREIRDGICDLLDQLPPSALLDVPRAKYGCGPGTPAAMPRTSATSPAPPAATRPPPSATASNELAGGSPASPPPDAPAVTPAPATPGPSPSSPASAAPPVAAPTAPAPPPDRGLLDTVLCALPLLC